MSRGEENFQDIPLVCKDCQDEFLFTVGEQQYYFEKGLQQPKRCRDCRKANAERKAKKHGSHRD